MKLSPKSNREKKKLIHLMADIDIVEKAQE